MTQKPNSPLLSGISQFEVDFVIPRVGLDLPLGIDPFLLFKSRDPKLAALHIAMLNAFNKGVLAINENRLFDAHQLFDFPEVAEIGFGYTRKGKKGSGVGSFLSSLLVETLIETPLLRERGIRHIEEMQLVSIGIGPDRVSDMAANLLKAFLIDYTQKQCKLWDIPLVESVPISHVFDLDTNTWYDSYFRLPLSPLDETPMLFVPRRIVRTLPWINYDDFFRMEFSAYLRAKRVRGKLNKVDGSSKQSTSASFLKNDVVALTRSEISRIDRYITIKEEAAYDAQPSFTYIEEDFICPEVEVLKTRLKDMDTGTSNAAGYQRLVLEILNFLFNPELINGELEVRTIDGTERRDIIFTNDSDKSFWAYLRSEHSSIFLMFETKNVVQIDNNHINQVAAYLGDRLGRLGFIVTRRPLNSTQQKKIYTLYNDSHPRKIILVFSDQDLIDMLDMRCHGKDPMRHIQNIYRKFRTNVQ